MYGNDDRSQRSSVNQLDRGQTSSSYRHDQARPGVGVPAFPRSRHTRRSGLSLHQIATTRNTQFGTRDPPLLTGHAFQSKEVHAFIQYIYQLIRAEAFDETVLEKLVDDEAMGVLTLLFKTSEVASVSPATNGWTYDWDVATIIEALEECYPLLPEQKYLDRGSKWAAVVKRSRELAEILPDNMERVRQDVLFAWNKARVNIGPIPRDQNRKILKHLQTCFSSRDNPAGQRGPNERFQQELDELIESDREYYATPSIDHLCDIVAQLMHKWEKFSQQHKSRHAGLGTSSSSSSSSSSSVLGKQPRRESSKQDRHAKGTDTDAEEPTCQGCNRTGHKREDCYFKTHPDFVKKGPWIGSATERAVTAHLRTQGKTDRVSRPVLLRHLRADGTRIEEREVAQPPTPSLSQDSSGRRDREERNRRGDQGD